MAEYCSAADIKTYLGTSLETDDTLLGLLAARATDLMDAYCGRRLVVDEDDTTTQYYTVGRDTEGSMLFFDDLTAGVTEVLNGDASQTEVASDEYTLIERNKAPYWGIKILRSSGKVWQFVTDPEDAIEVTLYNGYFYKTIPDDIKHLAIRLAVYLYKQRDTNTDLDRPMVTSAGVTLLPGQLPRDIKDGLAPYVRTL